MLIIPLYVTRDLSDASVLCGYVGAVRSMHDVLEAFPELCGRVLGRAKPLDLFATSNESLKFRDSGSTTAIC